MRKFGQTLLEKLKKRSIPELIVIGVISTSGLSFLVHIISSDASSAGIVTWVAAWLRDFSTDLAGGGLTFLFIKWLLDRRREETPELEAPTRKTTYIIEAEEEAPEITEHKPVGSVLPALKDAGSPEARQRILDRARDQDHLTHSLLIDADLQRADLNNANLYHANLTKANLRGATLKGATLAFARLHMAQLIEADLHGADLTGANLERAFLSGAVFSKTNLENALIKTTIWGVNLTNANMRNVDLRGAELFKTDLTGADLTGAQVDGAKINYDTILPDGSYWNSKRDFTRFTDPNHPTYWRSDNPESPAYRGAPRD